MQFFGFIDVNKYCLDWDFSFKHIQKRTATPFINMFVDRFRLESFYSLDKF